MNGRGRGPGRKVMKRSVVGVRVAGSASGSRVYERPQTSRVERGCGHRSPMGCRRTPRRMWRRLKTTSSVPRTF